jgi:C-terminal processing protease CtpA/Prc
MRSELAIQLSARRAVLRRLLISAPLVMGLGPATAQEATGTFGFLAKVDADGVFNPRLKSVLIQSVAPGGPAAAAGIAGGDAVVEVEGRPVAGAAASELSKLMKKAPGQKLVLKLKRAEGEPYVVELTAVARP